MDDQEDAHEEKQLPHDPRKLVPGREGGKVSLLDDVADARAYSLSEVQIPRGYLELPRLAPLAREQALARDDNGLASLARQRGIRRVPNHQFRTTTRATPD